MRKRSRRFKAILFQLKLDTAPKETGQAREMLILQLKDKKCWPRWEKRRAAMTPGLRSPSKRRRSDSIKMSTSCFKRTRKCLGARRFCRTWFLVATSPVRRASKRTQRMIQRTACLMKGLRKVSVKVHQNILQRKANDMKRLSHREITRRIRKKSCLLKMRWFRFCTTRFYPRYLNPLLR